MEAQNKKKPLWLTILRWSARISSILFIIFAIVLLIFFGGASSFSIEYYNFRAFAPLILYIIGLIIGFWREGLGGLISLVFIAFGIIILTVDGIKLEGLTVLEAFWFMFIPSILYILSWYFHRRLARQQLN